MKAMTGLRMVILRMTLHARQKILHEGDVVLVEPHSR